MKLNIVTKKPLQVLSILQELYPYAHISYTEVCDDIHDFELVKDGETVVYSLEGLKELSYHGIPDYNIRIY